MNILVGTSGYQYREWKGTFYPDDMSIDDMLSYYAGVFSTCDECHQASQEKEVDNRRR